ncbi:phage tail protein [Roseospira navarrensis]|uniref:Phage tail protein n=1 Tax=Roseospira navarrensis TaxID=140058 RepID=A0A7X2D5G2_9PROT|nr:phage tail protein [Roseospira navarrensis]MQX37657.1 phage tail protein [Roseospira navarrensis]
MAQFTKNNRIDPYKNFKFRVHWEGSTTPVAGISKISALKRMTEVVSHREGNDISTARKSPGSTKYEPITLERGVTFDRDFETWANLVYSTQGDGAVSLKNFRRNIIILLLNLSGQPVRGYKIYRCWVSEYQALPEVDANAQAVAIESIKLEHEGFERDEDIKELEEP